MKLSEQTKQTADAYVQELKAKLQTDFGITLKKNKAFRLVRQAIQHELHLRERERAIADLRGKAEELGFILCPKPNERSVSSLL